MTHTGESLTCAVCVCVCVWKDLRSKVRPAESYEDAHRREALLAQCVWKDLHSKVWSWDTE